MVQPFDRMKIWSYVNNSDPLSKMSGIFNGFRKTVKSNYQLRHVSLSVLIFKKMLYWNIFGKSVEKIQVHWNFAK
jgi:hypothetical protein